MHGDLFTYLRLAVKIYVFPHISSQMNDLANKLKQINAVLELTIHPS